MRNLPKLNTTAKESAPLVSLEQVLVDVISHEQLLVDVLSCLNFAKHVHSESVDLLVSCWRPFVPAPTTPGPEHGRVVRNRRAASWFDFGPRPLRRSKLSKTGPGFGRPLGEGARRVVGFWPLAE